MRTLGIWLARKPWRWQSASLGARADRLRRQRSFAAAIPLYRQYLSARPDHATAWMLFGHCLKENRLLAEAGQAYAEAVRLDPRNPDALEAQADFLKASGRHNEAQATFLAADKLGGGANSRRGVRRDAEPGEQPAKDTAPGTARVWVDITDLLIFLDHNRHLSGIQRVQMALLDHVIAHPDETCCVTTLAWDRRIWCFSRQAVLDMHAIFLREAGGGEAMRAAILRLRRTAAVVSPVPGATLFMPGAFWIGGGNPPLLRAVRSAGMRVVPLIHDLIPLRRPEVCVPALVEEFTVALGEALREVDGVIANSAHTAADVAAVMARHSMPPVPVIAVPLAHQLNETVADRAVWSWQIEHLRDRPFVLTVGTIEPRKNHRLLLGVWQALVEEGLDPPMLIIAGKRGWMTDAFDTQMHLTREIDRRVKVLSDLSDPELDALYSGCLFTAFPSLAEGWGLPVGESLSRGKVCVASDRDSMPEVGGDAALYFDPEDVAAAVPVFRRLLFEPGALEAAEAHLKASFHARGWPDVVRDMMAALTALPPASSPADRPGPLLPAGTHYRPAPHLRDVRLQALDAPFRLMLADGWERPTAEGAAIEKAEARLRLTVAGAGTLRLRFHADRALTVLAGSARLTLADATGGMLEVPVTGGAVALVVSVEGPPALWLTGVSFHPD